MNDARPWTHAALFGTLWASAEITLGTVLAAARVPMFGLLMASLGVLCMVTARRLQPAAGTTLVMGLVVTFLKVFFAGGLALGSVVGILTQALLLELALTASRSTLPGALIGGALALATAPLQLFLFFLLFAGGDSVAALDEALRDLGQMLGAAGPITLVLLAYLVGLSTLLGALVGAFSWRLAGRVRARVRGRV
jgi:hypothetical protein